jgi:ribosomal protein S18 acetylase RimI-like enzyme
VPFGKITAVVFDFETHFIPLREVFNNAMKDHPTFLKVSRENWKAYWGMHFYENHETFGFLAVWEGKIIGFALGQFLSTTHFELYWLAVECDFRKRGVGSYLMTRLKRALKEKKCRELTLDVDLANSDALGFFYHLGFF